MPEILKIHFNVGMERSRSSTSNNMLCPVEHTALVNLIEQSMLKSASTLLKGKVEDVKVPNENAIETFEPSYGLIHGHIQWDRVRRKV